MDQTETDEKQAKPTRSMTYPLRDPKAKSSRRNLKQQGGPIDAEDLSRRLNLHLAEQKERAETQRRNRAAKAAAQQAQYRHVPTVAALSFERTMTPDVMRNSPKPAQHPVMRAHLEALKIDNSPVLDRGGAQVTSLMATQARDRETLDRQMLASRNQFQWSQDLENANEADMDRDLFRPPQRTFEEFAYLKGRTKTTTGLRPMSTGDVVWEDGTGIATLKPKAKPLQARVLNERNDRHDWAQRDDEREKKPSPVLRKRDSNWILSGIKSMKHDRGAERSAENSDTSPPDTNNQPKIRTSIFARFKRNAS